MTSKRRKNIERWSPLLLLLAIIVVWEVITSGFGVSEFIFPSPSRIWSQTMEHSTVILAHAWRFASQLRNAIVLWRGKAAESLPKDVRDAEGVYRIVGGAPGTGATLTEQYRKAARRSRQVTERLFYGGSLR